MKQEAGAASDHKEERKPVQVLAEGHVVPLTIPVCTHGMQVCEHMHSRHAWAHTGGACRSKWTHGVGTHEHTQAHVKSHWSNSEEDLNVSKFVLLHSGEKKITYFT